MPNGVYDALNTFFQNTAIALRQHDLNPQSQVVPKAARSQWGGFLHLLYLPILLCYIFWQVDRMSAFSFSFSFSFLLLSFKKKIKKIYMY